MEVKSHLPYDEQLAKMVSRGLAYSDRRLAMLALKRIGYYRLSAYTYPFRAPSDGAADSQSSDPDMSAMKSRSEMFVPGSTFDEALRLYSFDEKLRQILLEGLNSVEVGISMKIAYTLGKRDSMAHTVPAHLDLARCDSVRLSGQNVGDTEHQAWTSRYEKLKQDAIQEEYVKHHVLKYGGNIPIWAAVEFLDFGSLIRLFNLMKPEDTRKIANELGLHKNGATTLFRWLKALNILRNHCAHSNRVWNRSTVDVPPKFSVDVVGARLSHLNDLDNAKRQKVYYLAALIAYLLAEINPNTDWPRSFRTVARKLRNVHGMTVESSMGFPEGWDALPLWGYQAPI